MSQQGGWYAWLVWFLASVFCLFQFFLQVASSMMTTQYMDAFHLDSTGLGFLSSAFFYSYVLIQVPAGLLLDYFSIRTILPAAVFLVVIGCVLFAMSPTLWVAIIARVLMGIGAGFAFVSMVFISAYHFPRRLFALLVGLGEFIGMSGTAGAERWMPHIITSYSWRAVMLGCGCLALILMVLMRYFLIKTAPSSDYSHMALWRVFWRNIKAAAPHPIPWLSGIIVCAMFAMVSAFASLWGVPFLEYAYHMDYYQATSAVASAILGVAVGGPTIGAFNARLNHPKLLLFLCCLFAAIFAWIIILFGPYSMLWSQVLLFLMGFFVSGYVIAYAIVDASCSAAIKGTAMGICNMVALSSAIFLQPFIGVMLTHFKTVHLPTEVSYRDSVMVLPGIMVVALLAVLALSFMKQSGHESK